jgi:H+-transporting ATPase
MSEEKNTGSAVANSPAKPADSSTNPPQSSAPGGSAPSGGLTGDEARSRLERDGPNAMPDTSAHPLRDALAKFWAPVPWLLEAAIVLQVVLHKYIEAAVIGGLLVFNAALAYFQEGRAQATLAALKSRLEDRSGR